MQHLQEALLNLMQFTFQLHDINVHGRTAITGIIIATARATFSSCISIHVSFLVVVVVVAVMITIGLFVAMRDHDSHIVICGKVGNGEALFANNGGMLGSMDGNVEHHVVHFGIQVILRGGGCWVVGIVGVQEGQEGLGGGEYPARISDDQHGRPEIRPIVGIVAGSAVIIIISAIAGVPSSASASAILAALFIERIWSSSITPSITIMTIAVITCIPTGVIGGYCCPISISIGIVPIAILLVITKHTQPHVPTAIIATSIRIPTMKSIPTVATRASTSIGAVHNGRPALLHGLSLNVQYRIAPATNRQSRPPRARGECSMLTSIAASDGK